MKYILLLGLCFIFAELLDDHNEQLNCEILAEDYKYKMIQNQCYIFYKNTWLHKDTFINRRPKW